MGFVFEQHLTSQERAYLTKSITECILPQHLAIDEWVCILLKNSEFDLLLFLCKYRGSVTNFLLACIDIQKTNLLTQFLKKNPQNAEIVHNLLMYAIKTDNNLSLIDFLYHESGANKQFLIQYNDFELVEKARSHLISLLIEDCEESQLGSLVKKSQNRVIGEMTYLRKKHDVHFKFDRHLFSKIMPHIDKRNLLKNRRSQYVEFRLLDFLISEGEVNIFFEFAKEINPDRLTTYYKRAAHHGQWEVMVQLEALCPIPKWDKLQAFVNAAESGKLSIIKQLLQHNEADAQEMLSTNILPSELEDFDKKDFSAFHQALDHGHQELVEFLLASYPEPVKMITSDKYGGLCFYEHQKGQSIRLLLFKHLQDEPEHLSGALKRAVVSALQISNLKPLDWLFENYGSQIEPIIKDCFKFLWKMLKPATIHWLYQKEFWHIEPEDTAVAKLLKSDINSRHAYLSYYEREILLLQEYAIINSAAKENRFDRVEEYLNLIPKEEQEKALRNHDFFLYQAALESRNCEFLSKYLSKLPNLPQEFLLKVADSYIAWEKWAFLSETLKHLENPVKSSQNWYNLRRLEDPLIFNQILGFLCQDEQALINALPSILSCTHPLIIEQIIARNDEQFHQILAQPLAGSGLIREVFSADIRLIKWIKKHHNQSFERILSEISNLKSTLERGHYREFHYLLKQNSSQIALSWNLHRELVELLFNRAPLDLAFDFLKRISLQSLSKLFLEECKKGLHRALKNNHIPLTNCLLNLWPVLDFAESHEMDLGNYITQFMEAKYDGLQSSIERASSDNTPFQINDENAQKSVLCILRRFIRNNTAESNRRVAVLLQVPTIACIVHHNISDNYPGGNELLRLAQREGNRSAIMALIEIEAIRNLAAEYNFYQGHGENLAQIIQDRESSMRALNAQQKKSLKALAEHYDEKLKLLTIEDFREAIINCYESEKAYFKRGEEKINLPCEWSDFLKLALPAKEYQEALEAHYKHPIHTALRYISEPNYWVNKKSVFIKHCNHFPGEYSSIYASFQQEMILLWIAATDEAQISAEMLEEIAKLNMTPEEFVKNRFRTFLQALALLNRAHNWDTVRITVNINDEQVKEEYDDLLPDNPSCYSGTLSRLFYSVVHHPMLEKFSQFTLEQELIQLIKRHFEKVILAEDAQKYYDSIQEYFEAPLLIALDENLKQFNIQPDEITIFINGLIEKYGTEFSDYPAFLSYIYKRLDTKTVSSAHILAFYGYIETILLEKIKQAKNADENKNIISDNIIDELTIPKMEKIAANSILPQQWTIPKVALLNQEEEVNSQIACKESTDSEVPPHNGNKDKIRHIVKGLIKNIECKHNHRESWFSHGTHKKVQKLRAIESWLSSNDLDAINEKKILSLIRDISSIKRNPLGFFAPHSLTEFKDAMEHYHLQCSETLHFSGLDSLKEDSDITHCLNLS